MKRIIALTYIMLTSVLVFAGGGWTKPKGKGYFKLSEWWLVADQHYTDAGLIDPNVTTGLFNTSLYAEYGFTDRIQGEIYFPFFSRTYMNNLISEGTGDVIVPGEAINGIGDTDVSVKYGITKGRKIALSASLTFGLPLGESAGGSEGNLQTGDGEFNQMLKLTAGNSFSVGKMNSYAQIYAGLNNRTQGFSDEFRYGAEVGIQAVKDKLWVIGRVWGVESLRNGNLQDQINSTSLFANNSEFTSFGMEAAYNFTERWGVSAGASGAFRGEIIFAAPSYTAGIFFNL